MFTGNTSIILIKQRYAKTSFVVKVYCGPPADQPGCWFHRLYIVPDQSWESHQPTLVGDIVLPVESADCCFLNHDRNCSLMFLLWWCFWLPETLDMMLKLISDFEIWKQERWGSGMNIKHHCCKIWQSGQEYMENSIKVDHYETYVTKDFKLQI